MAAASGGAPRIWIYYEGSLPASSLDASGYMSNAGKLGVKVNDLVLGLNTSTGIWSGHIAAHVELRTLIETELEAAEKKDFDADGYKIEDTGDVLRRLAVVREADGKLMRDGFKTKQDAAHYIATELMTRAAS